MNQKQKSGPEYQSSQQTATITYAHDLAGNLTFLNQAAERVSGYSCEEARSMNLAQIVAPEFVDAICEQIAQSVRNVSGTVYEVDIITRDGRRVALEVSTEVVKRNGLAVEIAGIAVPSVLRTNSLQTAGPRCLDAHFGFGVAAIASAPGRHIELI